MTKKILKLYDDLYYEIFNDLTNWILTNNINYKFTTYRNLGYFPIYDKDDCNRIPANWFAWQWTLKWYLLYAKLENRIEDKENLYPLAIFEDEKLTIIHDKIITWYERHRLHPKFNKPASNRKLCYRPTQYNNARRWLQSQLTHELWKWKEENNIHFHLKVWSV